MDTQARQAYENGSGFILQMDSNSHLGQKVIKDGPNNQNANGKLICDFLERLLHLTLINAHPTCKGLITRIRNTVKSTEKSILDVFVTCHRVLPYVEQMRIDENRSYALSNFKPGKVTESDHNVEFLDLSLKFSRLKPERIELFNFKDKNAQTVFQTLTTETNQFTECFENDSTFEDQATNWRKTLDDFIYKSFKKIRIRNDKNEKKSEVSHLLSRRIQLKSIDGAKSDEIELIEDQIAQKCQTENRKKIFDNFRKVRGSSGNLEYQGIWGIKRKVFPKVKPSLPVAKKNLKGQLVTSPEDLKSLYLNTFKF